MYFIERYSVFCKLIFQFQVGLAETLFQVSLIIILIDFNGKKISILSFLVFIKWIVVTIVFDMLAF